VRDSSSESLRQVTGVNLERLEFAQLAAS